MSPSPGITKRGVLTFVFGIASGFLCTYLLLVSREVKTVEKRPLGLSHHFIPDEPHSHGEMDHFAGPEQEQQWSDTEAHDHQGILSYHLEMSHCQKVEKDYTCTKICLII